MDDLLKSRLVSHKSKCHLYLTLIRPVLIYGCETWATTATLEERLRAFERKVLRKIFGPFFIINANRWERMSKDELYNRFSKPDVVKVIERRSLQWAGHVVRAENSRPTGTRPVGRPRIRWKDKVEKSIRRADPIATLSDATDRSKWTTICDFYV